MLKRMIRGIVRAAFNGHPPTNKATMPVEDANYLTGSAQTGMTVFPISNGYLMRVEITADYSRMPARPAALLVYAKDEKGIAEEIIANQARNKMGVGAAQGEMFEPMKKQYAGVTATQMNAKQEVQP